MQESLIVIKNLVTESIVWKTLPHERIIPFIGIEFKAIVVLPTMVSPWMENGNARTYVEQVKGQGKVFRSRVNKLVSHPLRSLTSS